MLFKLFTLFFRSCSLTTSSSHLISTLKLISISLPLLLAEMNGNYQESPSLRVPHCLQISWACDFSERTCWYSIERCLMLSEYLRKHSCRLVGRESTNSLISSPSRR